MPTSKTNFYNFFITQYLAFFLLCIFLFLTLSEVQFSSFCDHMGIILSHNIVLIYIHLWFFCATILGSKVGKTKHSRCLQNCTAGPVQQAQNCRKRSILIFVSCFRYFGFIFYCLWKLFIVVFTKVQQSCPRKSSSIRIKLKQWVLWVHCVAFASSEFLETLMLKVLHGCWFY